MIVMTWTSANVFNITTGCFDKKQCRRLKRTTIDKLCMYVNRNVIFFKEMREWRIGLNGVKCGAVERGGGNVTKTI